MYVIWFSNAFFVFKWTLQTQVISFKNVKIKYIYIYKMVSLMAHVLITLIQNTVYIYILSHLCLFIFSQTISTNVSACRYKIFIPLTLRNRMVNKIPYSPWFKKTDWYSRSLQFCPVSVSLASDWNWVTWLEFHFQLLRCPYSLIDIKGL